MEAFEHFGSSKLARNWDSISRFLAWILSGQCFFDINDWLVPADEAPPAAQAASGAEEAEPAEVARRQQAP